ncbi:hypothetical protein BDP27DRAFT_1345374 [Rhodocollybia butyracea]|uniref:Uncharacterized protein n=1 Tax=Rhodocollybia butyracea TaxID=206335 RepID=A0A9P5P959_9AGAR|nr:hypothetical protein BDP27DRAFT_1345374 [Rhodocollybia butyracea]
MSERPGSICLPLAISCMCSGFTSSGFTGMVLSSKCILHLCVAMVLMDILMRFCAVVGTCTS